MATGQDGEARGRGEATSQSGRRRASGTGATSTSQGGKKSENTDSGHSGNARPRLRAADVAQAAVDEVHGLTGRQVEGVTFVQRGDEGWNVGVEVVESRIPDTTDTLAVYEANLDESGELVGYRRVERYSRGKGSER